MSFDACKKTYSARHFSGERSLNDIRWIILHSTEGTTARGAAAWFANEASQGSAHLCVDEVECYRTLTDNKIPWAAPGANTQGLHLEIAGFAAWSRTAWLTPKNRKKLKRAAFKTAQWCVDHNIPIEFRDANDLKKNLRGITTHYQVSQAFRLSHHWDPGPHFPLRWFLKKVKRYRQEIAQRRR